MAPLSEKFESLPFTTTGSGRKFYPTRPERTEFNICDIARGLSKANRWNGQTGEPYSVAQHSVLCAEFFPNDTRKAYRALMHDAAEAYIGDIARPIKALLPDFKRLERTVEAAIFFQFDVEVTDKEVIDAVHMADLWMLFEERRQLFEFPDLLEKTFSDWTIEPAVFPEMRHIEIIPWDHNYAEHEFLNAYRKLRPNASTTN
jgi:uncharacterized protein